MDSMSKLQLKYASPVIRVYEDGHVERLKGTDREPPGKDPITHVSSKDIIIEPIAEVSVRLYLPEEITSQPAKKLPILIYYHGGGFCTESVSSPTYHNYLNSLASHAKVLGVSVEYRLAPEFPLPTAFSDSWIALQWVLSHVNGGDEQWLIDHGDFGRVFLAGDSAGGNIAHQMALRARENSIEGMVLIHPGFWGSTVVGLESTDDKLRNLMKSFWSLVCPDSKGVDDPFLNPVADGAPSLSGLACKRVLVCVAEMDFLKERGRVYYEKLRENIDWNGEVELCETQGEEHVFHLLKPNCENAFTLMNRLVSFFNVRLN